ncbi:hypothetical protein NDU88_006204 [Pleurodeles waltl]|uniref:Uncharacterized protein n=1 Tax=Pleurodeles waltl TaxID=8319 RepID=A0AAV7WE14_PLEWA|nr:hypothetical protein NDU88_006204 [Pleurodeles waltl]
MRTMLRSTEQLSKELAASRGIQPPRGADECLRSDPTGDGSQARKNGAQPKQLRAHAASSQLKAPRKPPLPAPANRGDKGPVNLQQCGRSQGSPKLPGPGPHHNVSAAHVSAQGVPLQPTLHGFRAKTEALQCPLYAEAPVRPDRRSGLGRGGLKRPPPTLKSAVETAPLRGCRIPGLRGRETVRLPAPGAAPGQQHQSPSSRLELTVSAPHRERRPNQRRRAGLRRASRPNLSKIGHSSWIVVNPSSF